MKLNKKQKKEKSVEFAELLKGCSHVYFTDYKGLKFQELADLRSKLKPLACKYQVVKNSLLAHALRQAGLPGGEAKLLAGPNALVVSRDGDPVSAARVLVKFAKEFPSLRLKGGLVAARWLGPSDCQRLSEIGTRPELLGKLAGTLYSAVAQGAWVLAAPIRDLTLVLKALQEKKSAQAAA